MKNYLTCAGLGWWGGGRKHTLEKRKKERGITKQRERVEKKKDKGRRETDAYREGGNDADE